MTYSELKTNIANYLNRSKIQTDLLVQRRARYSRGDRRGRAPEWEFFDCVEDPLELINCYGDSRYSDKVSRMRALLDAKMSEIGDVPRH